jgi:predicted P-loop ATPase
MADPIKLPIPTPPPNADAHARADTERKKGLFEWAEGLLEALGLDKTIAAARSIDELRRIALDVDSAEIALELRDALHPASGQRQEHFRGLKESSLKAILRIRFAAWKKDREAALRRGKAPKSDWADQLILDKDGKIRPVLANLILILGAAPKWQGVLGYNEFAAHVVIRRPPPWGSEPPDAPWVDHHESLARAWFQKDAGINPSAGDLGRAVQAAARHNAFHPVRDYFGALVWDGVPRLDAWLVTYFHVEDSPYIRAIGPRYLISSVARIYRPGCKVDHTLVLEGLQGKQKSEGLRILAVNDAWFTDRLSHVSTKDAAQEMAGVLIIEIAELDALTRATASATKSFLTRRLDRYRPPYGKYLATLPRQCVFAGTINPPAEGYLKDPTGARRLWPVACRGMVDLAGLEVTRDQLWAEAVHRFKAGAKWHLETPELEALATAEQEARFVVDDWQAPIVEWLKDRTDVSVGEVLVHALGIAKERHSQSAQTRVARILAHRLGFKKRRPRVRGDRENRYRCEPSPAKVSPVGV